MIGKLFKIAIVFISLFYVITAWSVSKQLHSSKVNEEHATVLKHLEILSSDDFAGRKFASEQSRKTQNYLISTLKGLAIPAFNNQYRHPFNKKGFLKSLQGTNIIAYIPGTNHVEEYIILSAHYDHLGIKRNKVFNGADDNASGIAALLHYGKLLSQQPLKHSVILLFTDGEEVDLLGAKAFIKQQGAILDQFKLNINLDMIAGSKQTKRLRFISKDLTDIISTQNLEGFKKLQEELKTSSVARLTSGFRNTRTAGLNVSRTNWRMASDHGVFSKAGVPFIYFGVGPHKNYHSELDDFAHVNQRFFLAATAVIFQQIIYLDNAMSDSKFF